MLQLFYLPQWSFLYVDWLRNDDNNNKKAVLSQGNRVNPQLLFSVYSTPRRRHIHCKFKSSQASKARLRVPNVSEQNRI